MANFKKNRFIKDWISCFFVHTAVIVFALFKFSKIFFALKPTDIPILKRSYAYKKLAKHLKLIYLYLHFSKGFLQFLAAMLLYI